MHLKSISMKGFKSFPERTMLQFGNGVSVVVGPNGSGKSNITDAVLWALGEQSPLAVRGQSMQDVIFAGGHGVQARTEAEVEIVLDNSDGVVDLPASELSIVRRLSRNGEGEYRLNGARCRLIDVMEVLSDTGLGKEAHSVISQGRVEAIVTSKPKDRRMLIEEAAGLGKHRKRRRRAQLKLERTQQNLDRALDVEREARAHLRPLKRQAEAAELHERLERQSLEARWELARDEVGSRAGRLAAAAEAAAAARAAREEVEGELALVARRREEAEQALAQRSDRHDELARRVFGVRGARDRVSLRLDAARSLVETIAARSERRAVELAGLRAASDDGEEAGAGAGAERVAQLEAELEALNSEREAQLTLELESLEQQRAGAAERVAALAAEREALAQAARGAAEAVEAARAERQLAERAAEAARRESARVGAELAAVNQFLRSHAGVASGGARVLERELEAEPGCERALAAVLGARLGATLADDRAGAARHLDGAGRDGGRVLVLGGDAPASSSGVAAPCPGARRLAELVRGPAEVVALAGRLLADAWLVEDIADVPGDFGGVAVTPSGRVWLAGAGELRQAPEGGAERALAERNRRERLLEEMEQVAESERAALAAAETAQAAVAAALDAVEATDVRLREGERACAEAREHEHRAGWLIAQRRANPDQGELAVRRAQLDGELAAERRAQARVERERAERARRVEVLERQGRSDAEVGPQAELLAGALATVGEALAAHAEVCEAELAADREAGEGVAGELRRCAAEEAALQARLRGHGEQVTAAEVAAQQARDQEAESRGELVELAGRLGLEAEPATEPLGEEERESLRARVERLARRREQLGPVNPLAADEYREALERMEELEAQRADLEAALRELRALIRDTDRQITQRFEETFEAAARNFEELIGDVFPGGRGRLRLVAEDAGPRAVLGGEETPEAAAEQEEAAGEPVPEASPEALDEEELLGVEIEVTPAGKSMKRLTLLSGGEKSMTAIAFLFAVFLARPCPFYILDEVEAALDDLNIDRFLTLLRRHSGDAQFIVVTHQKRTMEAADWLYGVSMGGNGVSKVVSRRLGGEDVVEPVPLAAAG